MAPVIRICLACDKEFSVKQPSVKSRFCSRQCWLATHNVAGAEHTKKGNALAVKTLKSQRGSGTAYGRYVKEDGRHQHRVVAERLLGRKLILGEVVHHEDHDTRNNSPENLIVFPSNAEHMGHHAHLRRGGECTCNCIRFKKQTSDG